MSLKESTQKSVNGTIKQKHCSICHGSLITVIRLSGLGEVTNVAPIFYPKIHIKCTCQDPTILQRYLEKARSDYPTYWYYILDQLFYWVQSNDRKNKWGQHTTSYTLEQRQRDFEQFDPYKYFKLEQIQFDFTPPPGAIPISNTQPIKRLDDIFMNGTTLVAGFKHI